MMRAWQEIEGLDDRDALIGAVSDGAVRGRTTAEVAEALGLSIDGATLREALEALVDDGALARRGVGRGALYICALPSPDAPLLLDAPLPIDGASSRGGAARRRDRTLAGQAPAATAAAEDMIVLIAEDERAIAELVSVVVADAGFTPVVAGHGREALALARLHRPALVITDLMMPHLTGVELITALHAEATVRGAEAAPVILMTASGAAAQARAAGADVVLAKPFALEALEALLRRFLGPPVPPRPPLDEPDEEGRAPGAVRTAR